MEQGFDSDGERAWRPIHHEARGIQGIREPLVCDSGNGYKAIGVLCRSGHAPETRGDGSADGIGHAKLFKHTGEPQNDVSQGCSARGLHRRMARRSDEGFSTRECAWDREVEMPPDGDAVPRAERGRGWPSWCVPSLRKPQPVPLESCRSHAVHRHRSTLGRRVEDRAKNPWDGLQSFQVIPSKRWCRLRMKHRGETWRQSARRDRRRLREDLHTARTAAG